MKSIIINNKWYINCLITTKKKKIPLVLQKFDPDFPPLAAHWTHLDNERINASSPAGNTDSLKRANWSAKYTFTIKLADASENCT